MGILQKKPGYDFDVDSSKKERKYRDGYFMKLNKQEEIWKRTLNSIPIFRKKASDPFRNNPQMNDRISFKDPATLYKFLSPGGRILGARFTGVRARTQRRIRRQIHKARFLGLMPFSANVLYNQPSYQPQFRSDKNEMYGDMTDFLKGSYYMRDFLMKLENEVQVTGNSYWLPPQTKTNPKFKTKVEKLAYLGRTKKQLEEKANEISHLNTLDDTLVPMRKIHNTFTYIQ